jgi:hypothetical protein
MTALMAMVQITRAVGLSRPKLRVGAAGRSVGAADRSVMATILPAPDDGSGAFRRVAIHLQWL